MRRALRGLTLVDMLVGLAIGLFVVSQGLLLLGAHLHENKGLILEARLMQDLRATAAAIGRDLRRAGHWGDAGAAMWHDDGAPASNPYQSLTTSVEPSETVRLHYSRDALENHAVDVNEAFGFRLRNQAIDTLLGGSWQTLSDVATLRVTLFRLNTQTSGFEPALLCDKPCPPPVAGLPVCPPQVQVRQMLLELAAESPVDPSIRRSLRATTRLRNDAAIGECPR